MVAMRRVSLFLLCAALAAGLFLGKDHLIDRFFDRPPLAQSAYAPKPPERAATGAAKTGDLAWALARVTVEDGAALFRRCGACHKLDPETRALGPHLVGVVGREIAALPDFGYSEALARHEGAWSFETLSAFIADPRGWAPGTSKTFSGVPDVKARAAILLYLNAIAPQPVTLPHPMARTASAE
jgi:cytochrome c